MSDVILAVIIVLCLLLLAAVAVMDWVAIASLLSSRTTLRHGGCGHVRAIRSANSDRCWRCRHGRLDHLIEAVEDPLLRR